MANSVEVSTPQRASNPGPLGLVQLGLELPADVSAAAFAIDDIGAVLAALDGPEWAAALPASFARKRRAEFLAGRHAASVALRALGLPTRVERTAHGLPVWPSGAVGSIAHGGGVACALAARSERWLSIGVDAERILLDTEARELAPAVGHQDELFLLRGALPHARGGQCLSVLFSAKESCFKCLFPLSGTFFEFSDARLVGVGMTSALRGVLALRLERQCGEGLPSGRILQARFTLGARRVESAVLLGRG